MTDSDDKLNCSKRAPLGNGYFPPPWDITENPQKTEGWCAFQDELRKNPEYYSFFNDNESK